MSVYRQFLPLIALLGIHAVGCRTQQPILAPSAPSLPQVAADVVVGQANLDESGLNRVDARGLFLPSSVVIAETTSGEFMYIADQGNHRIVRRPITADGTPAERADLVLGQPTFGSNFPNGASNPEKSLASPAGLAVGPQGQLAIADAGNNRIVVYTYPGADDSEVLLLGETNPDPDTDIEDHASVLRSPLAVAYDAPREHLWVADTGNNRLLRFSSNDTDGAPDIVLGQEDFSQNLPNRGRAVPHGDTLNQPTGLAILDDKLAVADAGNNRVVLYDLSAAPPEPSVVLGQGGRLDTSRRGHGAFGFFQPTSVHFDGEGHLVISDTGNNRVLVYPPGISGEVRPVRLYGQPTGLGGRDPNSDGIGRGTLNGPVGITTDSKGRLWIADVRNHRVLGFDTNASAATAEHLVGQFGYSLAEPNSPDGSSLAEPRDAAVDFSTVPPRLYIADGANNRVLAFRDVNKALEGDVADLVLGPGDSNSTQSRLLATPTAVLPDGTGGLYISDRDNNRILWFRDPFTQHQFPDAIIGSPHGAGLPSSTTLHRPEGIMRDREGRLYVADTRSHRILRFSRPFDDPVADLVWGQGSDFDRGMINQGRRTGPDTLAFPFRMDISPEGILAVADTVNHRVLLFDLNGDDPTDPVAVLGQGGDYNSSDDNHGGCSATSLSGPEAVLFYHDGLLVADTANCRVLFFPNPMANDSATMAWGQNGSMDVCDITAGPPSATNFWFPTGLSRGPGGSFLVTDRDHHRLLAFFP